MNRSLLAGTARHDRRTLKGRYGRSMACPSYPVSLLKERSDLAAVLGRRPGAVGVMDS
jgi:hypothetical protein